MSLIARIYPIAQQVITEGNLSGMPPTTAQIQNIVFGSDFNGDSRSQRDAVYATIVRGRDQVILKMNDYFSSKQYRDDLADVEFYANKLIDEEEGSADYADFFVELYAGRFEDKTELIKGNLRAFALMAVLWTRKLREFSKEGTNLVIANYGRTSRWRLPSLWKWAIRETNLYLRSISIIEKQLVRGVNTNVAALPGSRIKKAIGYVGSTRAALEDQTSWTCNCGMINPEPSNYCSNCGTPKS